MEDKGVRQIVGGSGISVVKTVAKLVTRNLEFSFSGAEPGLEERRTGVANLAIPPPNSPKEGGRAWAQMGTYGYSPMNIQ
jgi:hypothetical protein